MKSPSILVLLISMLLLGCAKEDFNPTKPKIVKEIDSIVVFNISENEDTSYYFIYKFMYGKNYSFIRIVDYSWGDITDQSYPIFKNKITIQHKYSNQNWRQEYFFNNKHYLIKERFVDNKSNKTTDSTTYTYDAFDRLVLKKFFGNTSSGEMRKDETHFYHYFWQNSNLVKIIHNSIRSNNILINNDESFFYYGNEINPLSYLYQESHSPIEYNPLYKTGIASKNLCTSSNFYYGITNYTYKLLADSSVLEIRSTFGSNTSNFTKIFIK